MEAEPQKIKRVSQLSFSLARLCLCDSFSFISYLVVTCDRHLNAQNPKKIRKFLNIKHPLMLLMVIHRLYERIFGSNREHSTACQEGQVRHNFFSLHLSETASNWLLAGDCYTLRILNESRRDFQSGLTACEKLQTKSLFYLILHSHTCIQIEIGGNL